MAYRSYEDLDVWKDAVQIAVDVYGLVRGCKDFGLRDQMSRSAVSIASNIAEGAERNSAPDFIRFLHMAKGSSAELRTQLLIASKIGLIAPDKCDPLRERLKTLSAQLQRLATALKKQN